MKPHLDNGRRRHNRRDLGFSMVEVMIGMAIGMLGVVVMMQVFALSEGQKRTTTSGADAQANGIIATNTLERDLRMAGDGITNGGILGTGGCTSIKWYYDGVVKPDRKLAPVTIVDGDGGNGSDTITVSYGNALTGTVPATIAADMPQASSELNLDRVSGFTVGDLFVVSQGGVCVLMEATTVQTSPSKLQHNPGASGPYNPPAADIPASWPAFTTGALVFDMGQMTSRTYSVVTSAATMTASLQMTDMLGTIVVLVDNIVNVQAQYGIAPAGSNIVNCWVNATAAGTNACDASDWVSPTSANIARIKAVRIAVLARSTLPEKPSVTGGACDATATIPQASWSAGASAISVSGANAKCYRYKLFETVIPLRNVIWANL